MRSEVISEIFSVEEASEQIITHARDAAKERRAQAEKEASELYRHIVQKAHERSAKTLQKAERSAEAEMRTHEENIEALRREQTGIPEPTLNNLADAIISLLSEPQGIKG